MLDTSAYSTPNGLTMQCFYTSARPISRLKICPASVFILTSCFRTYVPSSTTNFRFSLFASCYEIYQPVYDHQFLSSLINGPHRILAIECFYTIPSRISRLKTYPVSLFILRRCFRTYVPSSSSYSSKIGLEKEKALS
jgi:hypothetical protein